MHSFCISESAVHFGQDQLVMVLVQLKSRNSCITDCVQIIIHDFDFSFRQSI